MAKVPSIPRHVQGLIAKVLGFNTFKWLEDFRRISNDYDDDKMDKVPTAGTGNISVFNADGQVVDGGKGLPGGDVVGTTDAQTLTNKTIDGDDNTLRDLALSVLKTVLADADKLIVRDATGAVIATVQPTISDFTNANHDHQDEAGGAQLDHGLALTGLGDDDHPHYYNQGRGDARYMRVSQIVCFENDVVCFENEVLTYG